MCQTFITPSAYKLLNLVLPKFSRIRLQVYSLVAKQIQSKVETATTVVKLVLSSNDKVCILTNPRKVYSINKYFNRHTRKLDNDISRKFKKCKSRFTNGSQDKFPLKNNSSQTSESFDTISTKVKCTFKTETGLLIHISENVACKPNITHARLIIH